jgi:hypothetical protein
VLYRNFEIKSLTTVIFPAVLYGCATWSVILKEVRRPWVFDNGALKKIAGPQREEVKRGLEETSQ